MRLDLLHLLYRSVVYTLFHLDKGLLRLYSPSFLKILFVNMIALGLVTAWTNSEYTTRHRYEALVFMSGLDENSHAKLHLLELSTF
jgi:hypothetical protein